MKRHLLIILLTINAIFCFGQNLISNWKFQGITMNIRCDGWYNSCGEELTINCDTSIHCNVGFHDQSPSAIPEEIWSLQLDAGFPQEGFAETYVTGQNGTNIYKLRYWMQSTPTLSGNNSIGICYLGLKSQNQFITINSITDSASNWNEFILIDTITTVTTDTIAVRLSAGICDFCFNRLYFDYIDLRIIGTLNSIENINNSISNTIKVFPNPAKEKVTIEIIGNKKENLTLNIYNTIGQLIRSYQNNDQIFILDNYDFSKGLYFYEVQTTTSIKIVGKGKLFFD